MKKSNKILIISSWGFPPAWFSYKYKVSIDHPLFKDISHFECTSCCSTLVLVSALRKLDFDTKTIIFGLDSVANPSNGNPRKLAKDLYTSWLKVLVTKCSCCGDLGPIEIEVLPGIGKFYGWSFKGSVDHLFNMAFNKLVTELNSTKYNWIFLDITHGINFQTIAILHAVVASVVLLDVERRLIVMNSEPAQGGEVKCIRYTKNKTLPKELSIIDVSRLQRVVYFIRLLRALKTLDTSGIGLALKELKHLNKELVKYLKNNIIPFFKLLRNGIVAVTFASACIDMEDKMRCPIINICIDKRSNMNLLPNYNPVVDVKKKTIEYPKASIYESLNLALYIILNRFCEEIMKDDDQDLIKYMKNITNKYKKYDYTYAELITKESYRQLELIMKYLEPYLKYENGFTVYTYRLLLTKIHDVRKAIESKHRNLNVNLKYVRNIVKSQLREMNEINKNIQEIHLRDSIAHAGLEYAILKEFITKANTIKGIVYNKNVLSLVKKLVEI